MERRTQRPVDRRGRRSSSATGRRIVRQGEVCRGETLRDREAAQKTPNWPMPGSAGFRPGRHRGKVTSRRSQALKRGVALDPRWPKSASRWTSYTKRRRRPRPGISKPWWPRRKNVERRRSLSPAFISISTAKPVGLCRFWALQPSSLKNPRRAHYPLPRPLTSWSHRRTVYDGTIARR